MSKILISLLLIVPTVLLSQPGREWQHLDPEKDNVLGISTFKAYEFLKDRKADTVIVAVLDNGVELTHEDLQGQLWTNPGEIAGNGIDDDKNGYIDDIHGWNFLGNSKGQNIKRETTELTRIYGEMIRKYGRDPDIKMFKADSVSYYKFLSYKSLYEKSVQQKKSEINQYNSILVQCIYADSIIRNYLKTDNYLPLDLYQLADTSKQIIQSRNYLLDVLSVGLSIEKLRQIIINNEEDLKTRLNPDFEVRKRIIGDDPADLSDSSYGNNMVQAEGPLHGTGVAGTIAALWNMKGVHGVAKNAQLMILRVLPNGDERDKDIALAIRYAVRNKAKIINCSFGKSYSQNPEFVEQAIKEAEDNDVLIVHAAGNDGRNNDSILTYPTGFYPDGRKALNWIEVGASNAEDNVGLLAYFTNYGKETVDVFAPGVDIPSCSLGSKYDLSSGTSTAAPVVSGIAAVLWAYYPTLTAFQIREIIIQSVYKPKSLQVKLPGKRKSFYNLNELSVSGGIVNLFSAIQMAENKTRK